MGRQVANLLLRARQIRKPATRLWLDACWDARVLWERLGHQCEAIIVFSLEASSLRRKSVSIGNHKNADGLSA